MKTLARSALVGIVATGADVVTLLVLVGLVGFAPVQANVPALLLGVAVQYAGNKYFAFEDHSRDHLRQGALFALVEIGTLALNAAGFHLLVTMTPMPYPLVRVVVTLTVYLGFSFPLWRRVFRPSPGDVGHDLIETELG
jgi:putative flippase GtrA